MVLCSPAIGVPSVSRATEGVHMSRARASRVAARAAILSVLLLTSVLPASAAYNVQFTVASSPFVVTVGLPVAYPVTVTNSGGNTLNHVTVTGQLDPAFTSFRSSRSPMPSVATPGRGATSTRSGPVNRPRRSSSTTPLRRPCGPRQWRHLQLQRAGEGRARGRTTTRIPATLTASPSLRRGDHGGRHQSRPRQRPFGARHPHLHHRGTRLRAPGPSSELRAWLCCARQRQPARHARDRPEQRRSDGR